jgi:hypothetical protein
MEGVTMDEDVVHSDEFLKKSFQLCDFTDECDHCHNPEGKVWGLYTGYPVCEWDYYCTKCASEAVDRWDKEERLADEWNQANEQSCLVCHGASITHDGMSCPHFGRFEVVTLEVLIERSKSCGAYSHNSELSVTQQLQKLRSTGDGYVEI